MIVTYNKISALICESLHEFDYSGAFIYRNSPCLLLRGFALDMPPGSCYISKYCTPLFEAIDFLHLQYGYRVPDGFFSTRGLSKREIATTAVGILRSNQDFAQDESVDDLRRIFPFVSRQTQALLRSAMSEYVSGDFFQLKERANSTKARLGLS